MVELVAAEMLVLAAAIMLELMVVQIQAEAVEVELIKPHIALVVTAVLEL